MAAPESVYLAKPGPGAALTLKWISLRLVLPIIICGTIAAALQTTIAGGPNLAAADLTQLASLTPDETSAAASEEATPVAPPRRSAPPSHSPVDAQHQAAAAMLLLLVATAKKRGGEARRQAAAARLSANRQTADAGQLR